MNKILTLFDIEFKKIQKVFFSVLGILTLSNILIFVISMYISVKSIEAQLKVGLGLGVLKTPLGKSMFMADNAIPHINKFSHMAMLLALIWCLYYSIRIWQKDFNDKTKSIHTLFMLPENKFIIFLSKLLTMIVLVYGVIFLQYLYWLIESVIISKFTGVSILEIIRNVNIFGEVIKITHGISIYPTEFLMYDMLGTVVIITVLFTAVLMSKAKKRIGGLLGAVWVISVSMVYYSTRVIYSRYSDRLLIIHVLFYIVVFSVSICLSYYLLNKKIYD